MTRGAPTIVITHPARLLTKAAAAAYCGVSVPIFDQVCPVLPINFDTTRERLTRYDVRDLDAWLERLKGGGEGADRSKRLGRLRRDRREG